MSGQGLSAMIVRSVLFGITFFVAACGASGQTETPVERDARYQIIGDSIFAWNMETQEQVAAFLAEATGAEITDHSMSGAQIFVDDDEAAARGLDILTQYEEGDWDWLIMNGGANDLEEDCGCGECDVTLDDMITPDADGGRIPAFLDEVAGSGVRVIYLGYYQVGIEETDSAACVDEFDALDDRMSRYADATEGVFFLSGLGLLTEGDLDRDGIHPNPVGSEILSMAISEAIEAAE